MLPSPTAAATRLTGPKRTSPQAKMPGHARLQQVGVAVERPAAGRAHVGAGEHVAAAVERDLGRQPAGLGVRADEDEQPAGVEAGRLAGRAVADLDRLERALAVHGRDLGPEHARGCSAASRAGRSDSATCSSRAGRRGRGSSRCARGWRRTARPARPSCRRRRCGRPGRACSAPRCGPRRTRCPCRRAGRTRRSTAAATRPRRRG